jgi:hypothetical protein
MAAPITTTATTLEGQFFEVSKAMQEAELSIPEANRPDNVAILVDLEALTTTITLTLEIQLSGTGGNLTVTPVPYLP